MPDGPRDTEANDDADTASPSGTGDGDGDRDDEGAGHLDPAAVAAAHRLDDDVATAATDETGFRRLTRYVERELEFATSHYNDDYLRRRLASRMRRREASTYGDYLDLLATEETERRALLDALSINVTGFFRDPEVWERVRAVLRELSAERRRVTAWSAGCADGREPYSLAMLAAADPRVDADRLRITATDISETALEVARRGEYTTSHTTDIAEELGFLSAPQQFVERRETDHHDAFRVSEPIRRAVTFERHDLIRDAPKSGLDLVLCRNLSIYIDSEYKESVIDTVGRSLRPGGYLVIGKTETIPRPLRPDFAVYDAEHRVYRRRPGDETDPARREVGRTWRDGSRDRDETA